IGPQIVLVIVLLESVVRRHRYQHAAADLLSVQPLNEAVNDFAFDQRGGQGLFALKRVIEYFAGSPVNADIIQVDHISGMNGLAVTGSDDLAGGLIGLEPLFDADLGLVGPRYFDIR